MTCNTACGARTAYLAVRRTTFITRVQRYERKPLSPDEQRVIMELLQEHVETQRWYVVVVLRELVAEIAIPLN